VFDEIGVIFTAEFLRRIRSRPYILGTLIGAASIALLILLPGILGKAIGGTTKALVLAGPAELRASAASLLQQAGMHVVDSIDAAQVPAPMTLAFLDAHHHASAAIVLSRGPQGLRAIAYARDPGGFPSAQVGRALMPLSVALGAGLAPAKVTPYAKSPLEVRGVETRYATEASADLARAVAYGLVFILYFAIIFNGQAILSAVAEEKTSRIAELLVATISPSSLLAGKVFATGATGLIQIGVWIAAGIALSQFAAGGGSSNSSSPQADAAIFSLASSLTPGEVLAFVAFFAIGYLQYAMLFASAASLITRTEDLGSVSGPFMLPIVVAFLIAQYALVSPNGQTAVVASLIPLVSPFVMFTRMMITEVPLWQTLVAIGLNLLVLAALVPIAGKVYRVGMLLYGRAPKLSQIWAVLRS